MAQFDYTGLEAVADELITEFGQTVTLRVYTHTPVVATPWKTTDTITDESVAAVMEDFSSYEKSSETIREGDKRFLIAANDLTVTEIKPDDLIIMGGIAWRVVEATLTSPGGTDLIWTLQARK